MPWILVSNPPDFQRLCRIYQEVAAETGRKLGLGESVGAFRAVHFGRTEAEAVALLRDDQLRRLQPLLRRLRLLGGVPHAGGRREVPARSLHAAAAVGVDARAHAQGQVRAGRHGRPGEARDRGAAQDRRRRRARMVRLVLRPGLHVAGTRRCGRWSSSPSTSSRRFARHGGDHPRHRQLAQPDAQHAPRGVRGPRRSATAPACRSSPRRRARAPRGSAASSPPR